jgi:hypothetical protein
MTFWDTGSFEHEDALMWVSELEETEDFQILAEAFETVLDQDGETPDEIDCVIAICAAEVVAGLLGSPADELPVEVLVWLEDKHEPAEELIQMARSSLKVVLRDSSLKQLWRERDAFPEWMDTIQDLTSRLEEE